MGGPRLAEMMAREMSEQEKSAGEGSDGSPPACRLNLHRSIYTVLVLGVFLAWPVAAVFAGNWEAVQYRTNTDWDPPLWAGVLQTLGTPWLLYHGIKPLLVISKRLMNWDFTSVIILCTIPTILMIIASRDLQSRADLLPLIFAPAAGLTTLLIAAWIWWRLIRTGIVREFVAD
jgi:hypothetical protein